MTVSDIQQMMALHMISSSRKVFNNSFLGLSKIMICISYSLAYLKYLNKYVLAADVSACVKYADAFMCQNYFRKIDVLRISVSGQRNRAKLSYINSSDTQMYWHILHMRKHLQSIHIYLNI
jgi:hypothetical protein